MTAPLRITSKPATELTPAEIAECYGLIAQAGIVSAPGMIEAVHLVHNPTVLLAHQQGRLVGFQTHYHYQVHTPFRAKKMLLVYGGLALQAMRAAGQGIAYHMTSRSHGESLHARATGAILAPASLRRVDWYV